MFKVMLLMMAVPNVGQDNVAQYSTQYFPDMETCEQAESIFSSWSDSKDSTARWYVTRNDEKHYLTFPLKTKCVELKTPVESNVSRNTGYQPTAEPAGSTEDSSNTVDVYKFGP